MSTYVVTYLYLGKPRTFKVEAFNESDAEKVARVRVAARIVSVKSA